MRICRPAKTARAGLRSCASIRAWRRQTAPPSNGSAATTASDKAPPATGPTRTPVRNGPSRGGCARKSTVLSMAIAQTQMEQTSSPTITVLTTQWACQNSVKSDRSEEVSGSTDCATSAGFMGTSFRAAIRSRRTNRRGAIVRNQRRARRCRLRAKPRPNVSRKSVPYPSPVT